MRSFLGVKTPSWSYMGKQDETLSTKPRSILMTGTMAPQCNNATHMQHIPLPRLHIEVVIKPHRFFLFLGLVMYLPRQRETTREH